MDMDEEKLIQLISNYTELYDPSDSDYMNQTRKNVIWKAISDDMNVTESKCKERWKLLRDGFRRAHKRNRTRSEGSGVTIKKWKYANQMNFLLPCLYERDTSSSMADEDEILSKPSILTLTGTPTVSRHREKSESASVPTNYLLSRKEIHEPNAIQTFFLAMAETVNTLPVHLQIQVKNKVYQAVSEAELSNASAELDNPKLNCIK